MARTNAKKSAHSSASKENRHIPTSSEATEGKEQGTQRTKIFNSTYKRPAKAPEKPGPGKSQKKKNTRDCNRANTAQKKKPKPEEDLTDQERKERVDTYVVKFVGQGSLKPKPEKGKKKRSRRI